MGLVLAAFCGLARDPLTREQVPLFLAGSALAWAAFSAGAWGLGLTLGGESPTHGGRRSLAVLAYSGLLHVLLLAGPPILETDIYRYLLDGKLGAMGEDPYARSPDEITEPALRGPYHSLINHPELPSIYPPLAQAGFALASWFGTDSLPVWKALAAAFSFGCILLLWTSLRRLHQDPLLVYWVACNPLWLKEYVQTGHADVIFLFFVAAAVLALLRGQHRWAAVLLGFAALGKWASLAITPTLLGRRGLKWLALSAAVVLVGLAPFVGPWASSPRGPFSSLAEYYAQWIFFAPLFEAAWRLGLALGLGDALATHAAHALWMGIWGLAVGHSLRGSAPVEKRIERAAWVWVAFLVPAQAIFPWYAAWALLLLPFVRRKALGWLWTLTASWSYAFFWRPDAYLGFKLLSTALLAGALAWDWRSAQRS